MKKWGLFLISLGSIFIVLYPTLGSNILVILQGLFFILIGIVVFLKSKKR